IAAKYWGQGYDWARATGTNRYFVSSLALNFAHYIRRSNAEKGQNIPIGIIHASSGGTDIRKWMSQETLQANGLNPTTLDSWYWNRMLAPLKRAKFRAVLWYQGCSDVPYHDVSEYRNLMEVLVRDYRNRWGENGELPFYAVQIGTPGYVTGAIGLDQYPAPTLGTTGYAQENNYTHIREAQRLWDLADTGTHGLAVIVDQVRCMGDGDLHPVDKNFVGRRLSLFARRDLYGEASLQTEGPVFSRAVREADGAVRLTFRSGTAKGLTSGRYKLAGEFELSRFVKMAGPVRGFALCGDDGVWKDAVATVDGETLVLRAEGLAVPTRFHYGYWSLTRFTNEEDGQRLSLYNGEGLPMSPLPPTEVEDATTGARVADPVFSPGPTFFDTATNVAIVCATPGATIRYTLDGSDPTESSAVYTSPIALSATTTLAARAFATGKTASEARAVTYTQGTAPTPEPDPQWVCHAYDPAAWQPLANNILLNRAGTLAGNLAFSSSGYVNNPACLTDGTVPASPDITAYVGFCPNASVTWTFDVPQTLTGLRLSTNLTPNGNDVATARKYGGLRIEDVYVMRSGSTTWEALGMPFYQKGEAFGGALRADLADEITGRLAENVVALKVVFLLCETAWSNVAEVEATGYATAGGTVGPVEPITPVAGSLVVDTTISDHCVLQRGTNNCVKGTATVGSTVTVTFGGVSASAVAGSDGSFSVSINPGAANATGRDLVVSDTVNTVTITDVVVGDVWYISGQSNVRYTVDALAKSKALADCDYPSLRMMMLPSANPGLISASDAELPCAWSVCSATTCTNMSATGFFFGRELVKAENVPVGVVVAAINGSYIANWLPNANCDNYMASRANHIALKGAVWYQGESDALNYSDRSYPNRLKSLVRHLRTRPGNEGLPVVVVQLPRYRDTYKNCGNQAAINCWGIFRVDQDLAAADMDGVVCVPTIEYGAEYNIHPSDKDLMGARIALAARNLAYGENVAYRCPYPTSVEKNEAGTTVTVTFPETTTLVATNDTASVLFGEDREMFSVGGANVMPAISADGHSLVFTGSFADATSVEYGICGYPKILFVDANGFPMPPFSLELTGGGSGGEPVETAATPTFSPAACSFYPATNVTLSCATSGATIRYTLDGSNPTSSSTEYTAPIALSATTTVKARAFAEGMNPSGIASATYTYTEPVTPGPHDDPPDPQGESVRTWTSGDYDPSTWTSLENNILAGLTAVATDMSKITGYASSDLSTLTDGKVLASSVSADTVGLMPDSELVWTFDGPKVLEKIRFSSRWNENIRAGITVKDILVKTSGSTEWVSLGVSFSRSGLSTAAGAQYALLSDPGLGYLALDVVALKFVSGPVEGFANYYAEIEAVGRTGGDAYPPALSGIKIKPWGTSAEFSGSVVSLGTGASSCDVYLAHGPDADHLGEPVNIYTGGVGAFHYEIEGLATNTTYSYQIAVSNNAATVMGCEASGSFATTSEVHPDWSGYKWAVIGDSLTDPTLAPGAENYYYSFVVRDTGIQLVYTNGVGSTGYKNKYNEDGGKAFYQRLLASPLPSDVDVVTIFGSVNDWGLVSSDADAGEPTDSIDDDKTTLAAYMNKAIDVVQAQAPNARLVLVGSLYYYNAGTVAHVRANETLRAVAAQRGVAFYDWLTEDPNDPLDFHHIADNPTAEGSFAQRYTRDCPTEIDGGNTLFGHPSAEYHEVWLSPHFRGVLTTALSGVPVPVTVATPTFSPASCNFYPTTNVTITCATSGATIYYTLDGSEPTAESDAYSAPIAISATTTVKARAFADGMNASAVASAIYTYTEPVEPPDPPQPGDKMFYIGETGYDSWSDAYNAAQNGDTITVGQNATMAISGGKTVTIDLAGWALNWEGSGYYTGATITLVDSDGDGRLTLAGYSRNVSGATVDLSALTAEQLALDGAGLFWTSAATVIKFPSGMALADCTPRLGNKAVDQVIVVQGVTYTWDGSNWVSDTPGHAITITAPQNGTLETSVTNNVAVGTVVTVTTTPAEGYQLVSVTTNGVALAGNTFTMPSEDVTVAATFEETLIATYDITITAPQNGTLETSVTNNVAAGTTVTVIATPASGYRLASVTTNGAAIVGTTFAMPAGDVTLAATFAENAEPTQMFYIGDTGYDSWADVYAAAQNGATITVGANAVIFDTVGKTFVLDLCGRSVEITSGWWCGNVTVIDSAAPAGRFTITGASLNVQNGTLDLSALNSSQFQFTGSFWTNGSTVLKFPGDMSLSDCTAKINMGSKPVGERIVVQGVTYTWNGTTWESEGKSYPEWIDSTSETLTTKYDTWAAKFNVADPTAAQKDAYLLNCANTAEAIAAAKAAFTVVSIAINADGTVDVGLPTAPDGGFNGTVSILGSETVNGTYHAVAAGTLIEALYRIPAASNDHFFKASLDL
ncbi:MAG: chitobiase/beta-hexosaminidase C-terminal domain-containing protein, partial [Kiritimatiellae bacterium]|nr:chitobiase/beta-hexosaminidase C-terminal domain-containing protein [Kiritimatiellia bacterium]